MKLEGNVFIQGDELAGLKLMEGLRSYDLILIASMAPATFDLHTAQYLAVSLNTGGNILIHKQVVDQTWYTLFRVFGIKGSGLVTDEKGNEWVLLQRKGERADRLIDAQITMKGMLKAASSVMTINGDAEKTATLVLECNFEDQAQRRYVIIANQTCEQAFESVRKQAIIYQTLVEHVVLEMPESIA